MGFGFGRCGYHHGGYGYGGQSVAGYSGYRNGFALIVVLFILLIIIGAVCYTY
ncbi:MAG TPA: YjcZ family sporulation protein [Bacillota bacterium]|nr:YjcZ family sporulation protein [Bacillota bacterium]